jgi:transcriptional regulator with XRE-family HTH domain
MENILTLSFLNDELNSKEGRKFYLDKIYPRLNTSRLAKFIEEKRKGLKWNQKKLAAEIGISPRDIGRFEKAETTPSYFQFFKICKWLKLSMDFFVYPELDESSFISTRMPSSYDAYLELILENATK